MSDSFLTLSFDWASITSSKEVIDLKNVFVNAVLVVVIGYSIFAVTVTLASVAYYAYVDFIR